jgi:quercetin dioxygenase-like cupin family protein
LFGYQAPLTVVATHAHSFAAKAPVVRGEMWLTIGERTEHIPTGGTFELQPGTPHSERYGAEGATYWFGRREVP